MLQLTSEIEPHDPFIIDFNAAIFIYGANCKRPANHRMQSVFYPTAKAKKAAEDPTRKCHTDFSFNIVDKELAFYSRKF